MFEFPIPATAIQLSKLRRTTRNLVVQFYHNESTYQHVEQASKDERDEGAAHDHDVVRHAEIGRSEVDEQRGGIDTTMRRVDRDEYGRR